MSHNIESLFSDPNRFFVDTHGGDDDAIQRGLAWLYLAGQRTEQHRAGIFVETIRQVEHLGAALGANLASILVKKRIVQINGLSLELLVERKLPSNFNNKPVLAVWIDDKQIEKLEIILPSAICVIPWNRDDIATWKVNWDPLDLRTNQRCGYEDTVNNQTLINELKSLTGRVNLSTGLGHPSDKAAAREMFRNLKNEGIPLDSLQIQAWATRHGWRYDHARHLGELA